MKKQIIFLLSMLALNGSFNAQNIVNIVIFSEDGDAFYTFINGVKQNNTPETNVKVTGVSPNVSLRIEFENKAYPQLKQNMPLEPGFEHTFRIKKDMKQQMKLRYFGNVPLNEASSGVATVPYHTANDGAAGNDNSDNTSINTNVNTTTTTHTTKTTTSNHNNEDVNVNINMAGVGINMNVNGMGTTPVNGMNSTTSTTVTSSSNSYGSSNSNNNTNNTSNTNYNHNSNAGCSVAMNQTSFDKMKQSIESKPFSETKMSTAKIATKNACVSVNQVKEICKLFSMDEDKLAYAKYAYNYCVNKAEYYQVSEIFSFSGTTEEFNKFLEQ